MESTRQGIATGRVEGRVEESRAFLQKLIAKRFGTLTDWASQRISQLGTEEIEDLGVRLLDAPSLEELFERLEGFAG